MTAGRHIDYEALAQEAMRGVVKAVLMQVARSGLNGDHHFYIAFNTQAPGVSLSKRLKEKYPDEMTIVLQHRFWDLDVGDDRFEVKLTFDGIPERLAIPYKAVKVFYDPSVPYGLQFEESELTGDGSHRSRFGRADNFGDEAEGEGEATRLKPRVPVTEKKRPAAKKPARTERTGEPTAPTPITRPPAGDRRPTLVEVGPQQKPRPVDGKPAPGPAPAAAGTQPARPVAGTPVLKEVKSDGEAAKPDGGAKIVDFSSFRKDTNKKT